MSDDFFDEWNQAHTCETEADYERLKAKKLADINAYRQQNGIPLDRPYRDFDPAMIEEMDRWEQQHATAPSA